MLKYKSFAFFSRSKKRNDCVIKKHIFVINKYTFRSATILNSIFEIIFTKRILLAKRSNITFDYNI